MCFKVIEKRTHTFVKKQKKKRKNTAKKSNHLSQGLTKMLLDRAKITIMLKIKKFSKSDTS